MSVCKICSKDFGKPWRLERHKNKKIPCKPCGQDTSAKRQDTSFKGQNTSGEWQNTSSKMNNTKCQFCEKEFKSKLKRHENSCPYGKDEVRLLEIQLGIPFKECDKLTCRYCDERFTRIDNLSRHEQTCVKKQIYLATLEGQRISKETGRPVNVNVSITNNINEINNDNRSINNNDNRSINNNYNRSINTIQNNGIQLRKFGEEDTSYITKGTIFNAMKKGVDVGFSRIIGEIHCNESHPENQNLKLTNIRSAVMDVFNGHEFEKQPVDQVIAAVLKKTTDLMFEHYFDNENYYDSNMFVRSSFNKLDSLDNNDPKDMKPYKQRAKCRLYNNSNKIKINV